MALFEGSAVAIATPMKENGEINYDVFDELIEDQLKNDTDAFVICGTTGEAPTLDDEEHLAAIRFGVERVKGRVPVIAGTGSNNTAHAIMMTEESEKLGADAVLLVSPYYNKATQKGLVEHYVTIAKSTKLPGIIYNVPSRTGTNVLPETMVEIAKRAPNFNIMKEASGNLSQVAKLAYLAEGKVDIYSGNDDQILPVCSLGGKGVISVLANVAPKKTHDMVRAYLDGDFKTANELQLASIPLVDALFMEVNPIPVKAGLNMQGFKVGKPRLPLTEMEEAHKEVLKKAMQDFGCL